MIKRLQLQNHNLKYFQIRKFSSFDQKSIITHHHPYRSVSPCVRTITPTRQFWKGVTPHDKRKAIGSGMANTLWNTAKTVVKEAIKLPFRVVGGVLTVAVASTLSFVIKRHMKNFEKEMRGMLDTMMLQKNFRRKTEYLPWMSGVVLNTHPKVRGVWGGSVTQIAAKSMENADYEVLKGPSVSYAEKLEKERMEKEMKNERERPRGMEEMFEEMDRFEVPNEEVKLTFEIVGLSNDERALYTNWCESLFEFNYSTEQYDIKKLKVWDSSKSNVLVQIEDQEIWDLYNEIPKDFDKLKDQYELKKQMEKQQRIEVNMKDESRFEQLEEKMFKTGRLSREDINELRKKRMEMDNKDENTPDEEEFKFSAVKHAANKIEQFMNSRSSSYGNSGNTSRFKRKQKDEEFEDVEFKLKE